MVSSRVIPTLLSHEFGDQSRGSYTIRPPLQLVHSPFKDSLCTLAFSFSPDIATRTSLHPAGRLFTFAVPK